MTYELQTISTLVKMYLEELAPILSGNMFREIATAELVNVSENEVTFCISAPFYDMDLWRRTGVIVHSGQTINLNGGKHTFTANYGNITDYANWVNEMGAFGKHNSSEHWVNRTLEFACGFLPNAEVINKLEV